ncbi:hypothetical protein AB6V29_01450 [Microbacterium sp. 20-116]|uniref:hypothetical protein n=1 Tax=Microbacterium sp. 20-116 TaxID=3239883 RepID=UPI0034E1D1CA
MRVTPPDVQTWLIGHVRALALAEGIAVDVAHVEPPDLALPLRRPLVVIRDDSGSRLDHTTFDRSIGASVLGGSKGNPKPANDVASWLGSILFDSDLPLADGSPIASVEWDGCNGPYPVLETLDVARRYLTAQYVAAGSW